MNDIEKLKERWFTSEFDHQYQLILNMLQKGRDINNNSGKLYNGKLDCRGLDLTERTFIKPVQIRNLQIENADFSHADCSGLYLKNCTLSGVLFFKSELRNVKFENTRLHNVAFSSCNFENAALGIANRKGPGLIGDSKFVDCNFHRLLFSYPVIKNTLFRNCNFSETDFNGSRLFNCTFIGTIENVIFRGRFFGISFQTFLEKLLFGTQKENNRMVNVNFSEARFGFAQFYDSIDLSTCIFPEQSDYIKINDLQFVFNYAKDHIIKNWPEDHRQAALRYINNLFLKDKENMTIDYVYKGYEFDDIPAEYLQLFWKTVAEGNEKYLRS